jgi:hypothetical protein
MLSRSVEVVSAPQDPLSPDFQGFSVLRPLKIVVHLVQSYSRRTLYRRDVSSSYSSDMRFD